MPSLPSAPLVQRFIRTPDANVDNAYIQRREQPNDEVSDEYREVPALGTREGNLTFQLGKSVGHALGHTGPKVTNPFGFHPIGHALHAGATSAPAAGLMGGALGGLAGALGGYFTDRDPLLTGAIGTGLGALGSYWLSNHLQSLAAENAMAKGGSTWRWPQDYTSPDMVSSALMPSIAQKIMMDRQLTQNQRLTLGSFLPQLSSSQLESLNALIRQGMGASVGVLVAKYLFKMGIGGMALMGLLGGMMAPGPDLNLTSMTGRDLFA